MRVSLETKLLEVTKERRRITLDQLAEHLGIREQEQLSHDMEDLTRDGFARFAQGTVEVDSECRMRLAERQVARGYDPQKIARLLGWQEFEDFAAISLERSGFGILKHFVFKTRDRRREIDLVAWSDTFLFVIDCKHWSRGISPSQARKVALAQAERAAALAERPDLLRKRGVTEVEKRRIMPVIFCLGDPHQKVVDGVPVVAVSKIISFLHGVSPVDDRIRVIPVRPESSQSRLL